MMTPWLWGGVLIAAAFAARWGADKLVVPLEVMRKRWGLAASAGAAFLAIITASPEVATNTVSAIRDVSAIGLGNLLGANIVSIPLVITTAYLASRKQLNNQADHQTHLQEHLLALSKQSVRVLSVPYLAILGLFAVLTVPEPWRGMQPLDGWIMLGAAVVFFLHAGMRRGNERQEVSLSKNTLALSATGALAVATGGFFMVQATKHIVDAVGISELVGGLFITGTMSTVPETFKTWSVVRGGKVTGGATSVIADNAITITVGLFPLALVSTPIDNFQIYWVNLAFMGLMPLFYSVFLYLSSSEYGFTRWQVLVFDGAYVLYILMMLFIILR